MGPLKQARDWYNTMTKSDKQGLKEPTIEDEVDASFARDRAAQSATNAAAEEAAKKKAALEAKTKDPKATFGRGVQEKLLEGGY
jgi:hypothetical protein